jgi:prepilin-type processing-associated H-X9-DG protein
LSAAHRQTARDLLDELRWIAQSARAVPVVATGLAASGRFRDRSRLWSVGLVAAGAAAGGLAVWLLTAARFAPDRPVRKVTLSAVIPRENLFVGTTVPALSPDGRMLAYVAGGDGKRSIWVRDLGSLATRELTGTGEAQYLFWSHDSRFIAFRSGATLKRVAAAGGTPQSIGDATNGYMGTWGTRDVIVYSSFTTGLFRIAAVGGERLPLTTPNESAGEISHRYPWFLPDGHRFLYLVMNRDASKSAVYVADLEAPDSGQRLFAAQSNVAYADGHILFARAGVLMAQPFDADALRLTGDAFPVAERIDAGGNTGMNLFTVSDTGVLAYLSGSPDDLQLTWLDSSGRVVGTVGKPGSILEFNVSADSRSVAFAQRDGRTRLSDIWIQDSAGDAPRRITFNSRDNRRPVWSSDGRRIAYSSVRAGTAEIVVRGTESGSPETKITGAAPGMLPEAWSAGHLIAGLQSASNNWDVWTIPTASREMPFLIASTVAPERFPRLSPDGRWVAYQALIDVVSEIYVNPVRLNSERQQVTAAGGQRPAWSPDGRRLFFHANDTLMAVDVTVAGDSLRFGPAKPLFALRLPAGAEFEPATGDRFLVPLPVVQGDVALTVVSNWLARD